MAGVAEWQVRVAGSQSGCLSVAGVAEWQVRVAVYLRPGGWGHTVDQVFFTQYLIAASMFTGYLMQSMFSIILCYLLQFRCQTICFVKCNCSSRTIHVIYFCIWYALYVEVYPLSISLLIQFTFSTTLFILSTMCSFNTRYLF